MGIFSVYSLIGRAFSPILSTHDILSHPVFGSHPTVNIRGMDGYMLTQCDVCNVKNEIMDNCVKWEGNGGSRTEGP